LGYSNWTRYLDASPDVKVVRPRGQGDITVELVGMETDQMSEPTDPQVWAPRIDEAWSRRAASSGRSIHGNTAAADAAKVFSVTKLSVSPYRTLQRLLAADHQLSEKWLQDGNKIVRR
jgi:hypothetical protein